MAPEILAILAACCFAGSSVAVRKGAADERSIIAGLIVALAVGVVVIAVAYVAAGPGPISINGVIWFAAAGIFGPGIGRSASMAGVASLGASVSVPLQTTIYPVAAVVSAIVFFEERVAVLHAVGAGVLVMGIWLLSHKQADSLEPPLPDAPALPQRRVPAPLFPVVAGLGFATADLFRKEAVSVAPDPLLGALVGTGTALIIWSIAARSLPRLRRRLSFHQGMPWFALSGVLAAGAVVSTIVALEEGNLSVVGPIVGAQPLPVLVFSALFLKQQEAIGWSVVLGGIATVIGATALSLAG